MLLAYGNTVCCADWRIDEKIPTGYCRVYYVLGGKVRYTDSQRQTDLRAGTLYVFPSATPYKMRQSIDDPLHCTFLHIGVSPALVTELCECKVEENSFLKHLLLAFSAAIDERDEKLVYALADVFELFAVERRFIAQPVHSLSNVLLYIADHIDKGITLCQLSSLAGYNEQYFIRLFRQSIGLTPYQYIISHRLNAAKKLLLKSEPITRVAELTGYRDIKSFSRAFKKSFGMSPSVFRKNYVVLP